MSESEEATETQQVICPGADAAQPALASEGGSGNGAGRRYVSGAYEQRRRGARSARNLARRLRGDRDLPADKLLLLDLTARIACHVHNLSLQLFTSGETRTADGEAKQALGRLAEMTKLVGDNLRIIFGDSDDSDDLLGLLGGQRR